MKIAHLEFGRHIYGGAAQVQYLLTGLSGDHHDHRLVCARDGELADWAQAAGQPHHAITMGGEHDLRTVWRLARWLRRERVDLVHSHSRRGADWMGAVAAALAGVPAILTRRVDNAPRGWLRWLMRHRYRRIVCISAAIHDVLAETGVADDKLLTIVSAVDVAAREAVPPVPLTSVLPALSEGAPVIGVIAQLIERKGHRFLLRVLPGLVERFPDLEVVFFGRGPLEQDLRQAVDEAGLTAKVHFAGFRTDLAGLLPSLTLVVHPALAEGLGVSLLEASAAGVPVVGFAAGGVTQAVADEHSGLLVTPGDALALGAAVGRLLGDDALRQQMGVQARRRVLNEFSVTTMVQRYAALYDVLAGEDE